MPFPYFARLSRARQRIYLASDAVTALPLPDAAALAPAVRELELALAEESRKTVERAGQELLDALCRQLALPPVAVRVLASRPSDSHGELHGLYEPEPSPARITVWMRTAARGQVVAFRTFLRTLLHELLHHHDYEGLRLAETFHTEGFFRREADLARQLFAAAGAPAGTARARGSRD
ncbi:MAG TPA: hypothetical protein VLA75_04625 [Thermoanaerobaculia bacterium]|nr:hypothetical protein [Thermoanaerobaculia bacterium]